MVNNIEELNARISGLNKRLDKVEKEATTLMIESWFIAKPKKDASILPYSQWKMYGYGDKVLWNGETRVNKSGGCFGVTPSDTYLIWGRDKEDW